MGSIKPIGSERQPKFGRLSGTEANTTPTMKRTGTTNHTVCILPYNPNVPATFLSVLVDAQATPMLWARQRPTQSVVTTVGLQPPAPAIHHRLFATVQAISKTAGITTEITANSVFDTVSVFDRGCDRAGSCSMNGVAAHGVRVERLGEARGRVTACVSAMPTICSAIDHGRRYPHQTSYIVIQMLLTERIQCGHSKPVNQQEHGDRKLSSVLLPRVGIATATAGGIFGTRATVHVINLAACRQQQWG